MVRKEVQLLVTGHRLLREGGSQNPVHSPTGKGPILIPKYNGASPYPQLERGLSISPTKKGLVHIPNYKGVGPYTRLERGQ